MGNSVTSTRLWTLDTASATALVAAGTPVIVRKVVYKPGGRYDSVVIQEYDSSGSAQSAIILGGNSVDTSFVALDFGPYGRRLNGMILSTLTSGGTLYVYLGED